MLDLSRREVLLSSAAATALSAAGSGAAFAQAAAPNGGAGWHLLCCLGKRKTLVPGPDIQEERY